jgi:RimJ/RimL family protein N-acetyltransferase
MNIKLKILHVEDITQRYVDWFNDSDVVKFSNNQFKKFTLQGQIDYVTSCLKDSDKVLYGIFDDEFHIGNIYLEGLESIHKKVELTVVIGEKSYWNKGVGTLAISEVVKLATFKHKLHKIFCGVAEDNIGSGRIFEKNNFVLEGKRIDHIFLNGRFYNQLDYGLIIDHNS